MKNHCQNAGFTGPDRSLGCEGRRVVLAELAAVAGLAISTVIAVTAVSVGIARASVVDGVIDNESGLFALALLLGLAFIGVGGFSLMSGPRRPRH